MYMYTYMYNDGVEELSWDGVWDVKTVVDSLGWMAEFRIPLGQLRFSQTADQTFGRFAGQGRLQRIVRSSTRLASM